jgi:hypothetical protein
MLGIFFIQRINFYLGILLDYLYVYPEHNTKVPFSNA